MIHDGARRGNACAAAEVEHTRAAGKAAQKIAKPAHPRPLPLDFESFIGVGDDVVAGSNEPLDLALIVCQNIASSPDVS